MSTAGDPPQPPPQTATTKPSPSPSPQIHHHHQLFPPQLTHIHYPLASSGRGFIPTSTSTSHHHRPSLPTTTIGGGGVHPHSHPQLPPLSLMPGSANQLNCRAHPIPNPNPNPNPNPPSFLHHHPSLIWPPAPAAVARGAPFSNAHHPPSKVGSSPYPVPGSNALINLMDKKPEDPLITVRDRKVRVSDRNSLYALCRSWLRNGYPEEIRPQDDDVLMSLPKPSPVLESSSPKRKERDDETELDEVDTNEMSSAEELLASHVKRAKRVRARLREERSKRIERYTSRLTLLLPHNGTIQE